MFSVTDGFLALVSRGIVDDFGVSPPFLSLLGTSLFAETLCSTAKVALGKVALGVRNTLKLPKKCPNRARNVPKR